MDIPALLRRLNDFLKSLDTTQVGGVVALIFLVGLVLLAFTFLVPILAVVAAIVLILGAVYIVYRFIGGK